MYITVFHRQEKFQDAWNLEILEGEHRDPGGWNLVINHREMEWKLIAFLSDFP